MVALSWLTRLPPVNHKPLPAAINTVKVASSRDRGTSPSSRACSNRLADAGSVFSASLSEDILDSCNHLPRAPDGAGTGLADHIIRDIAL